MRRVLLALLAVAAAAAGCLQAPLAQTREVVPHGAPLERAGAEVLILGIVDRPEGPGGYVTEAEVAVVAGGAGTIRIDAAVPLAADTKQSILDAAAAAAFVAGLPAQDFDYEVRLGPDAGRLSGPSAGSQFALGFYVAFNNLLAPLDPIDVRRGYAGTGTIREDGMIGPVGGVPVKASALEGLADLFAYPTDVLQHGSAWGAQGPEVTAACEEAALECVPVVSLADLVEVATVPVADLPA